MTHWQGFLFSIQAWDVADKSKYGGNTPKSPASEDIKSDQKCPEFNDICPKISRR